MNQNHRSHLSNIPPRSSKLHLSTLRRHLVNFLLQEVLKKPNFLPHFSSVVRLSRTEHVRTFSCIFLYMMYLFGVHEIVKSLFILASKQNEKA